MAEWPRCPHDYLSACPTGGPSWRKASSQGLENRCHAQSTQPPVKVYCLRASFKLERARSSAPQPSRADNDTDTKQAGYMRWLGENHDSTALKNGERRTLIKNYKSLLQPEHFFFPKIERRIMGMATIIPVNLKSMPTTGPSSSSSRTQGSWVLLHGFQSGTSKPLE